VVISSTGLLYGETALINTKVALKQPMVSLGRLAQQRGQIIHMVKNGRRPEL
jgi:hypothetical protein